MTPPPTPPQTPASPPPTPPTQGPGVDNTKAIVTLVLGILSIVLCCGPFTGVPAIFLGRSELRAIDEGRSSEANRGLAKVGYILGIVGTIMVTLAGLAYLAFIIFIISAGNQMPGGTF